ncbi:hypothetical protein [uncultured Shewanella sp.]|uniref:hypothetical protein n=1 Tax=uncultured Shewanella sp. TaxID=173975 RepID=UPI0026347D4D|nr:hypothetical protein [uncultured Shewanella sp.]
MKYKKWCQYRQISVAIVTSLLSACGGSSDNTTKAAISETAPISQAKQTQVLVMSPYVPTSTGSGSSDVSGENILQQDCAGLWQALTKHQQRAGIDDTLLAQINWAKSHKMDLPDLVKPQLLSTQEVNVYWQPNEAMAYRYGIAQVDSELWQNSVNKNNAHQNKAKQTIAPEQVQWTGRCSVPQGVAVLNADFTVAVPDGMAQWQNDAAKANQRAFAQTAQPILQGQYGKDGLGFGEHVKAGVSLSHEKLITPNYVSSHFGLQWKVDQLDKKALLALVKPEFPDAIKVSALPSWQSCDGVQLRVSSNDQFTDPSLWLAFSDDCSNSNDDEPLGVFTGTDALMSALKVDNLTQVKRNSLIAQHVKQYNNLADRVQPLGDNGAELACQRQDLLSSKGCRHQTLRSWLPLLTQYLSGEQVLYMQVVFADKMQKTYVLNDDGQVQELASQLLLNSLSAISDADGSSDDNGSDDDGSSDDSSDDNDSGDNGSGNNGSAGESDDTLEIMFATQTPLDGEYLASDCGAVLSAIQAQSIQLLLDEASMNTSAEHDKMRFASQLSQADNWTLQVNEQSLYVKPTQSVRYAYGMATVNKADWQANKIDIRALSAEDNLSMQATCDVPQEVAVMSPELVVSTAPALQHWVSAEAQENQAKYDAATSDRVRYGTHNVGYGNYLLGGLGFNYIRNYSTDPENVYSDLYLFWNVKELSLEALSVLAQAYLPTELEVNVLEGWASEGMDVAMRLANNSDMHNASITFGSHKDVWHQGPIFSLIDENLALQPDTPAFATLLDNTEYLHNIMSPRDESGNMMACNEYDTGTMNGCSQPILRSVHNIMLNTLNKEADLFLEFIFEGAVRKRYQINKDSGDITEVDSKVIGF